MQDNPPLMNALSVPGIWNVYAYSTQASKDIGRQIALMPTESRPDSITRLTVSSNLLEPLNMDRVAFVHDPSEFVKPEMQPFISSL